MPEPDLVNWPLPVDCCSTPLISVLPEPVTVRVWFFRSSVLPDSVRVPPLAELVVRSVPSVVFPEKVALPLVAELLTVLVPEEPLRTLSGLLIVTPLVPMATVAASVPEVSPTFMVPVKPLSWAALKERVPPTAKVWPEYVLAPLSVRVPVPFFTNEPELVPLMTPENVVAELSWPAMSCPVPTLMLPAPEIEPTVSLELFMSKVAPEATLSADESGMRLAAFSFNVPKLTVVGPV